MRKNKISYDIENDELSSSSNETISEEENNWNNADYNFIENIDISNNINKMWRVKYYTLLPDGNWNDFATGVVTAKIKNNDLILRMTKENKNNKEVIFYINAKDCIFCYHNDSIITWRMQYDDGVDNNNALSFLAHEALLELCELIVYIYGPNKITKTEVVDVLPTVEVGNLPSLAKKIVPNQSPETIAKIIEKIISNNCDFFEKMGNILIEEEKRIENKDEDTLPQNQNTVTDTTQDESITLKYDHLHQKHIKSHNNDYDSCISNNYIEKSKKEENDDNTYSEYGNLKLIFIIYKNILSYANQHLLEIMLSDDFYLGTFGALEYHFESKKITKHRDFLIEEAKFHNILNIEDNELLSKIHLIFRLNYLRDVAIGRFVEEQTLRNINMMIHCYTNEILTYLYTNKHLLTGLFDILE